MLRSDELLFDELARGIYNQPLVDDWLRSLLGTTTLSSDSEPLPDLVQVALKVVREQLQTFAVTPDFTAKMQLAFGDVNFNNFQEAWQSGNFSNFP